MRVNVGRLVQCHPPLSLLAWYGGEPPIGEGAERVTAMLAHGTPWLSFEDEYQPAQPETSFLQWDLGYGTGDLFRGL